MSEDTLPAYLQVEGEGPKIWFGGGQERLMQITAAARTIALARDAGIGVVTDALSVVLRKRAWDIVDAFGSYILLRQVEAPYIELRPEDAATYMLVQVDKGGDQDCPTVVYQCLPEADPTVSREKLASHQAVQAADALRRLIARTL